MRRLIPLLVFGAALSAGLVLVALTANAPMRSGSDEQDIVTVIEAAMELMSEACLETSRGTPSFATSLADYVSAATPDSSQITEMVAVYATQYPTPDPTGIAEFLETVATGVAEQDPYYSPGYATDMASRAWMSTPAWYPGDSALDILKKHIEACHDDGDGDFFASTQSTVSVVVNSVSVDGDSASADVVLEYYEEWTAGQGTAVPSNLQIPTTFTLMRENSVWRIASWDMDYSDFRP